MLSRGLTSVSRVRATLIGSAIAMLPRGLLNALRRGRENETDLLVALAAKLPPGCMVDVGARFGTSSEPFLRRGWSSLAFEPDGFNRAALRWVRRRFRRLTVDPRGVSDHAASSVPFYRSPGRSAISSLYGFDESHSVRGTIELVTLAEACSEHNVSSVELLKVDAEGHDLAVLRGFPWSRLRPRLVMCEFDEAKREAGGHSYRSLCDFILALNYRILVSEWYPVLRYSGRHRWRRIVQSSAPLAADRAHGNLIGIDPSFDVDWVRSVVARWERRMRELHSATEGMDPPRSQDESGGRRSADE